MRLAPLLGLALAAAAAAPARADTGPPGASPPAPTYAPEPYAAPPLVTRTVSYAPQTLVVDGLAAGLIVAGFLQDNPYGGAALALTGFHTYALGPPIVHLTHGRLGAAARSLGIRVALPLLGAIGGNLVGPDDRSKCAADAACFDQNQSTVGLLFGAAAGMIAASLLDAQFLARRRVVEIAPAIAPSLAVSPAGMSVGLTGAF